MAIEKKYFVDINLQGNKLVNGVVGNNADMTKAGSFRFNGSALEYCDGENVRVIASRDELNDLATSTGNSIADLQTQIDNVLSNVDGTALNSLSEIVAAFQQADNDLNGAITNLANAASTNLDAEIARATAAEATLQSNIDGVASDLASETSARITAVSNEATARISGDETLQSNLDAETAARIAAVTAEAETRATADTTLQSNLDAEVSRATTAENAIAADLAAEVTNRTNAVSTEAAARVAGDTALKIDLDDEVTARKNAITAEADARTQAIASLQSDLNTGLSDEIARATAAEGVLQSNIDVEKGRIDAILNASEADKDSFAEIVALINSVDTTNDEAFAGYVLSNNQALADEVTRATAAETALSNDLTAETARAEAAEATKLPLAGGTMSGSIDMGNNEISNVRGITATGTYSLFVGTDSLGTLNSDSISVGGNLDFDNSNLPINLPEPTNGGDAANKTYVDTAASTAQANAEATASADATAKADAAQAAAESNANAYTDTEIAALSYTQSILALEDWAYDNTNEYYYVDITHNLGCFNPVRSASNLDDGEVYELSYTTVDGNTQRVKSNTAIYVNVSFVKSNGNV